jgi:hypothetical protein
MAYYLDTRPVIVRTKHGDRESHYVMTAKEAGEAVVKTLTESRYLIGIQIIPVDAVSDKVKINP